MLRSLILMTHSKCKGITQWVKETKRAEILCILCGFDNLERIPGVGTYYDFMNRIIDGPYQPPWENRTRRSEFNARRHIRNFKDEKQEKKDKQNPNQTQSEKLIQELLPKAAENRPDDFRKFMEDLLIKLGIQPAIEQGFITGLKNLTISGDGSILQTAASPYGKPTCDCRKNGIYKCDHDKSFTTPTARWCHNHARDCFEFGDRYYHLVLALGGHDYPLLTYMPGGNESDYTLSLISMDRFLKAIKEHNLNMVVEMFCGDGHHDSNAHYEYFLEKNIVPIIPLCESSKNLYPHIVRDDKIRLDTDGKPLCEAGKRMRHHQYNKKQHTHIYSCPVKRSTHRNRKTVYVFREDECPNKLDCNPQSPLGPYVRLKSDDDPRLFPPVPPESLPPHCA